MDGARFDRFARGIALGATRRQLLRGLSAGAVITGLGFRETSAQTECAPGETECRGICADLQTDPVFCGSCDNACSSGACSGGVCVSCEEVDLDSCQAGDGFYCTDLQSDPFNCGACAEGSNENFCGSGLCVDGECQSTVECEPGLSECQGQCFDLTTDIAHCGNCVTQCFGEGAPPGICSGGQCVQCSDLGQSYCQGAAETLESGYCADLAADPNNCGDCGIVCPDGACTEGACATPAGIGDEGAESTRESDFADDIDALGFLLYLERLSRELLRHGRNTFESSEINGAAPGLWQAMATLRAHENEHAAALVDRIEEREGETRFAADFTFDALATAEEFAEALFTTKEAMIGAYLDVIASLADPGLIREIAPIATVEARHAASLATLRGISPFGDPMDSRRSRADILEALAPYIEE